MGPQTGMRSDLKKLEAKVQRRQRATPTELQPYVEKVNKLLRTLSLAQATKYLEELQKRSPELFKAWLQYRRRAAAEADKQNARVILEGNEKR
jgi:hypothetical protein